MAERVGFEPTYRLITDNSISSRARYGLFATFPQTCVVHEDRPAGKPFFRAPAADGRPRAAAGYRRSRTPCASRAFSPAGSPAASGRGQKPLPPCSFAAPRRKKRPAFTKRILFQCLANRRGVQTKRCRRSAQSGSLRRSSMSACSCAMSASSPSKRRS